MLCLEVPIRDTHKSPKIVCGLRTHSVECSKLGKTRIIADAKTGCLEMPHFLIRISRCIPSEIEGHDLLILLLITSKRGYPFHAVAPFFILPV